jgi:pyruvate dehydrogenase E1 component
MHKRIQVMTARKQTTTIVHMHPEGAPEDCDPGETQEWLESLEAMIHHVGRERAAYVLKQLEARAQHLGVPARAPPYSAYQNTIPLEQQSAHPGDVAVEERITAIIRWNALAMVVRANKAFGELGGHIASYASASEIFEVGFNHFFRARSAEQGGDLVFFQAHSAPGIYARAFLEGRLSEERLANFRQEVRGSGLCSYPHPWLMPELWQFPTGSMGLGPINSIYQARFMRYLQHRKLANTSERHVWGIFGDGEMGEPESVAALTLAAREKLDNLTFVVNCNLQRLDGPVRGNGQIIQELESLFSGAGWIRAYPQSIAPYLDARFVALGTDGFGRSDTRAGLRRFFEVDRHHITVAALQACLSIEAMPGEPATLQIALGR